MIVNLFLLREKDVFLEEMSDSVFRLDQEDKLGNLCRKYVDLDVLQVYGKDFSEICQVQTQQSRIHSKCYKVIRVSMILG